MKPLIKLNPALPGIVALFAFNAKVGEVLSQLAETILRGESPLTNEEKETIATMVSIQNGCKFCQNSHGAVVAAYRGTTVKDTMSILTNRHILVGEVEGNWLTKRMIALITVALGVTAFDTGEGFEEYVNNIVKDELGITDTELHDTVIIASAFNMFNRYVDSLGTVPLADIEDYAPIGKQLAENGYLQPVKMNAPVEVADAAGNA